MLEADLEATRRRGQDIITQRTLGGCSISNTPQGGGRTPRLPRRASTTRVRRRRSLRHGHLAPAAGAAGGWSGPRRRGATTRARSDCVRRGQLAPLAGEARGVLGFLAISLDNPADACEALRFVIDIPWANADTEPFHLWVPMAPDTIEALVTVRRLDDAERLLLRLEAHARSLGSTDGPRRRRHDVAPCCSWLGETPKRRSPLRRSRGGFRRSGIPARPRQSAARGRRSPPAPGKAPSRRRETRSREEIFAQLGAPLWLARAENEAQPGQATPRRDSEQQPPRRAWLRSSRQVHVLEVAAQLCTTVGTVEVHLTRIYRKPVALRTDCATRCRRHAPTTGGPSRLPAVTVTWSPAAPVVVCLPPADKTSRSIVKTPERGRLLAPCHRRAQHRRPQRKSLSLVSARKAARRSGGVFSSRTTLAKRSSNGLTLTWVARKRTNHPSPGWSGTVEAASSLPATESHDGSVAPTSTRKVDGSGSRDA